MHFFTHSPVIYFPPSEPRRTSSLMQEMESKQINNRFNHSPSENHLPGLLMRCHKWNVAPPSSHFARTVNVPPLLSTIRFFPSAYRCPQMKLDIMFHFFRLRAFHVIYPERRVGEREREKPESKYIKIIFSFLHTYSE